MANLYDLKKFDLNLLVIFECIYQHLSISKAAETLFITPSAVSQSLQRLRNQFNDPLFIRSGKGITPTTVGTNLHRYLENNLNQIEQTINIMHSSALKKQFIIYCSSLILAGGMLDLITTLRKQNDYEIEHHDIFVTPESAEDLLAWRKADLIISIFPTNNHSVISEHYMSTPVILACRKGHPRMGDYAGLSALRDEEFTYYLTDEPGAKQMRDFTDAQFPERKCTFRSDSLISIINMVANTDILGLIPKLAFDYYKDTLQLREIKTSLTLPEINLYMMYNRASLASDSFATFINQIKK
ncbi:DNA-binding transcriptional repressor CitR [Trabulsiella odontotermitis]|uniref:DNA-binding transcriptional repressor CitR n=1 Tax=Trabulsiella odontotermitis TaxID=379893 RepID=UPI000675ECD5|nr:LysR family transcriptional regulator [Trabulsiella odontotermitis]KNC89881.1 LysR family transcriptional regulator [Trabulsiella odontotermitis]